MFLRSCSLMTVVLASLGMFASRADARDPHIDEVAYAVRNDAALICREVRYHFRGSAHYEHLYSDAYEMYQLADHIHDVAHEGGDLRHIRADVEHLDELFHHLEELVDEVTDGGVRYFDQGGQGWHGIRRPHSSYHVTRLKRLVSSLEENLHHLQEDVDSVLGPAVVPKAPGNVISPVPAPPTSEPLEFRRDGRRFGITLRLN